MDIKYSKKWIELEKELNALDRFTIDFTSVLNKLKIKYVVVSGYVSILFGRSRSSEDIDIIMEKISMEQFQNLWSQLNNDFECITTSKAEEAYSEYLKSDCAIRFSRKNEFIPNIELKFPKIEIESWVLEKRKEVVLSNNRLYISPIELQIPFKIFLGSEKDIEDALYLYEVFKDKIDIGLMHVFSRKLKIEEQLDKHIK